MKKKLLALLLALAMTLSLAACGGQEEPAPAPEEPDQGVEDVVDETPADDVDGTTDEPAEGETDEVAETNPEEPELVPDEEPAKEPEKPAEKPAEKPREPEKPVEKPAEPEKPVEKPVEPAQPEEKPEEPAAPAADGVDLNAFVESLAASQENWPAMMKAEQETLDAFYTGLSDIATKQGGAYMAMITAAVGEIALVEVENADDVQAVKDIFQARVNYQVGDETNPGGAWYPASIEGWKNNSRIVSNGNFVMLIAFQDADKVVEEFNALFA